MFSKIGLCVRLKNFFSGQLGLLDLMVLNLSFLVILSEWSNGSMYNKLVFADKGSCTLFITCALCLLFTTVLHAESELWWDAHQSDYKSKRSMAIKFHMQQEANNFLMSLSREFFFMKVLLSACQKLSMSTQTDGKEGVKKTSHMINNTHPCSSSSSIWLCYQFPKSSSSLMTCKICSK